MGAKRDEEQLVGQLPGTGGDFIDPGDVEGHKRMAHDDEDAEVDLIRRVDGGPTFPDVEGDVEGHLYRGGPTTQGEIVMRGPGDNPHGER